MSGVSNAVKSKIVELYNGGLNGPEIAESLGIGMTTVYRWLNRQGIKPSSLIKNRNRKGQGRFFPSEEEEIKARYEGGISSTVLASEYNCHTKTITNIVKRLGGKQTRPGGKLRIILEQDIDKIIKMYTQEDMSSSAIGEQLKISQSVVNRCLRQRGISPKIKKPIRERHGNWKGGKITQSGYVFILLESNSPYYSMVQSMGYVAEHRLVMAQYLERPLMDYETVHHINGNKADNRLENLQLRIGKHGKGIVYVCADCGSHRILPKEFD